MSLGRRIGVLLFALFAAFHALTAHAVLGGSVATVQQDQMRVAGQRRQSLALGFQVHEIAMADGSRIQEFVSPQGVVFAVTWRTRFKPDLQALLGTHHTVYAAAVGEAMKAPGMHRHVSFSRGDLVVESGGRMGAFVGRAYLPSMMPNGTMANEVR